MQNRLIVRDFLPLFLCLSPAGAQLHRCSPLPVYPLYENTFPCVGQQLLHLPLSIQENERVLLFRYSWVKGTYKGRQFYISMNLNYRGRNCPMVFKGFLHPDFCDCPSSLPCIRSSTASRNEPALTTFPVLTKNISSAFSIVLSL